MQLKHSLRNEYDPTKEEWWDRIFDEMRTQKNILKRGFCNPFEFDINFHRKELRKALSQVLPKRGMEYKSLISFRCKDFQKNTSINSPGGEDKPHTTEQSRDPRKYCPVCDVTAGLSLCSGCKSIAFCCRAHQIEYWPKHKAECRAKQTKKKG